MKTKCPVKNWMVYVVFTVLLAFICGATSLFATSAYAKYSKEVTPDTGMEITFLGVSPTILSGSSWYKGNTDKTTIKEVSFVTELPDSVSFSEQWDASAAQNGSITAAVADSTVFICSNGAEKLFSATDASGMFQNWTSLETITNLKLLDMSKTQKTNNMFYGCQMLTEIDLRDMDVQAVTSADDMFAGCNMLQKVFVGEKTTALVLASLPVPAPEYIPDADGKWYSESTSDGYVPAEIPEKHEDTYVGSPSLLETSSSSSGTENGESPDDSSGQSISTPTMLSGASWYKGTTDKENITEIIITKKLPEQAFIEQWDASQEQNGSITAAVSGTKLYISSNNASEIAMSEDASYMFSGMTSLKKISGMSMLDTTATTNMRGMFYRCLSLMECPDFNSENWNTAMVWDMTDMFFNCESLTMVDLSGTETDSLQVAPQMFYGCTLLMEVKGIESWDMSKLTSSDSMFGNCPNLSISI